jgi:hypothetical protein
MEWIGEICVSRSRGCLQGDRDYRHRIGGFCCSGVVLYRGRRVGNSTVLRILHGSLPPALQTVSFGRGNEPQREDLGVKIFASHTQTQP